MEGPVGSEILHVAMCVCNPDRSTFKINRRDTPPTPTGFADIVSDDFPVLHSKGLGLFYSLSGNDKVIGTYEYAGEFQRAVC